MGCEIPYKRLNCGNLEELLSKMDNLLISKGPGGIYVSAKPMEKSGHVTELLVRQKTSKKRR